MPVCRAWGWASANQIYLCKKFVCTLELVAACLQTETATTSNSRFSDYFYIVGQQKKKSKMRKTSFFCFRSICLHDIRKKKKDLLCQSNWKCSFRHSGKHVSLTEFLRSVCRVQVNTNSRCGIHSSVLGISIGCVSGPQCDITRSPPHMRYSTVIG